MTSPTINSIDGDYVYDPDQRVLIWKIPRIDEEHSAGALDFSVNTSSNDNVSVFFPVRVTWDSTTTWAGLQVQSFFLLCFFPSSFPSSFNFFFFCQRQ